MGNQRPDPYSYSNWATRDLTPILKTWRDDAALGHAPAFRGDLGPSMTDEPVNPRATERVVQESRREAEGRGWTIPKPLWNRYGAEALDIMEIHRTKGDRLEDPEGFPFLAAQLRHEIHMGMVIHLEDFYLRRVSLFATRRDHGLPLAEALARIWAEERGLSDAEITSEIKLLYQEFAHRDAWRQGL